MKLLPTEWAALVRRDMARVAAHPCICGAGAQCGRCATCAMRRHLAGFPPAAEESPKPAAPRKAAPEPSYPAPRAPLPGQMPLFTRKG